MTSSPTDRPADHPDTHHDTHLDAVTRRVNTVTRDGEEVRVVVVRRTLDASPEQVWDALTAADRIARWFLPVNGDLRLGGRYQLEGNAGGEVLTCEAPERLALTWEHGGESSWVDVSLRPTSEGTLLQLDHSAPLAPTRWEEFGPGAVGIGWELVLMALSEHLAAPDDDLGAPADLAGFCDTSGAAWAEAAVADGDDPDGARAAAGRCVAAYVAD